MTRKTTRGGGQGPLGQGLLRMVVTLAVLVAMTAGAAQAQTSDVVSAAGQWGLHPPPRRKSAIGVRGFGSFDVDAMAAVSTFDAVLGTSRLTAPGGGGEVLGIWRGLFLRVEASTAKKTGSRVVVVDGQATSLGIPITVQSMPVGFGAGWRSPVGRRQRAAVYIGAMFVHEVYRETSSFAGANDNVDTTFSGAAAFAGFDVTLWKWIVAGAEGQFRSVPHALGTAGASQAFGETDLGGGVVRGLVGFKF